jgi:hypothetical protein
VIDQALSQLAPLDFDVWLRFGSQTSYAFQWHRFSYQLLSASSTRRPPITRIEVTCAVAVCLSPCSCSDHPKNFVSRQRYSVPQCFLFPYGFAVRQIEIPVFGVVTTATGNGAHVPINSTAGVFERKGNHLQILVPVTRRLVSWGKSSSLHSMSLQYWSGLVHVANLDNRSSQHRSQMMQVRPT